MTENPIEFEPSPRTFRCERAIGKLIDKYAKAWERDASFVIKMCLRLRFKDELPPSLRPKTFDLEGK